MDNGKRALLIGNGFTSHLIREYSNEHMMSLLRQKAATYYLQADQLFSNFRKNVLSSFDELSHCDVLSAHIKNTLSSFHFNNISDIYKTYFIRYGLIFETQQKQISSVETLLKIVSLFKLVNRFSNDTVHNLILVANQIYYNNGNNGLSAVPVASHQAIIDWLSHYDLIFTTNYDCILDDACGRSKVKHLHGGFYFKDLLHESNTKLKPEDACLIWGISGEDKQKQTASRLTIDRTGHFLCSSDGHLCMAPTRLGQFLSLLQKETIEHLDIFGYSGENDQHINHAISQNPNIRSIQYFCSPKDVSSKQILHQTKLKFSLPDSIELSLVPWNVIWDQIL